MLSTTLVGVANIEIRTYGDPVLRTPAKAVTEIDGSIAQLVRDMIETMYAAPGVGLAAPQIGVQKRIFVYDIGEGAKVMLNPKITESSGEWTYEEGCLSVPGLFWHIIRPKDIHIEGMDMDGGDISLDATEYLARVFQHEFDHLQGMLLLERLTSDQRKKAMKILRQRAIEEESGCSQ